MSSSGEPQVGGGVSMRMTRTDKGDGKGILEEREKEINFQKG